MSGPDRHFPLLAVCRFVVSAHLFTCLSALCSWLLCRLWTCYTLGHSVSSHSLIHFYKRQTSSATCSCVRQSDSAPSELTTTSSWNWTMMRIARWWTAVRYLAMPGYGCWWTFEAELQFGHRIMTVWDTEWWVWTWNDECGRRTTRQSAELRSRHSTSCPSPPPFYCTPRPDASIDCAKVLFLLNEPCACCLYCIASCNCGYIFVLSKLFLFTYHMVNFNIRGLGGWERRRS